MKELRIADITIGPGHDLALIAGPCVIEDEESCLETAAELKKITRELSVPLIFKSSYDKANRSSVESYRGPGIEEGLRILSRVKDELSLPVLTDIHTAQQASRVAEVADVIQIPAFLCRQTDLLVAAGRTGKVVNVKKGQFMAPWDMKHVVSKLESAGCQRILLTERGTFFGYNRFVNDFRSIPIMQKLGYPVVFDATHSVQEPGALGKSSGGHRQFVPHLARAAVASGCDLLFFEVHPNPDEALCDGPNSITPRDLRAILRDAKAIRETLKKEE